MAPIGAGMSERMASRSSGDWKRSASSPTVSLPHRRAASTHGSMRGPTRSMSRLVISSRGGRSEGRSERRQPPGVLEQPLDQLGVGGRQIAELCLEAVEVPPEGDSLPFDAFVLDPDVQVHDLPAPDQPDLLPQLVHAGLGRRPHEPVDAVVDGVALALPGGHEAARQVVHLVDARLVAVHLRIAAGAETGDPAADDRDRLARLTRSLDAHGDPRRSLVDAASRAASSSV